MSIPRRRGRSIGTRLSQIEGLVPIQTNSDGQSICQNSGLLSYHISSIVGNGRTIPLDAKSWKKVEDIAKEQALKNIYTRFEFDDKDWAEPWLMTKCNLIWKDAKHNLKMQYLDSGKIEAQQCMNRPNHVSPEQWKNLVKYWRSPEGEAKSKQGHDNRLKVSLKHHTGTCSYARLKEKERKKNGGEYLDPVDFFKLTCTPKGSLTVEPGAERLAAAAQELISLVPEDKLDATVREQAVIEVLGGPNHGRIPMSGTVPPRAAKRRRNESSVAAAMESAERVSKENEELRARIDCIEDGHKQEVQRLVEQMFEERRKEMEQVLGKIESMKRFQEEYVHGQLTIRADVVKQMVAFGPLETFETPTTEPPMNTQHTNYRPQPIDPYLARACATQCDDGNSDSTQP